MVPCRLSSHIDTIDIMPKSESLLAYRHDLFNVGGEDADVASGELQECCVGWMAPAMIRLLQLALLGLKTSSVRGKSVLLERSLY